MRAAPARGCGRFMKKNLNSKIWWHCPFKYSLGVLKEYKLYEKLNLREYFCQSNQGRLQLLRHKIEKKIRFFISQLNLAPPPASASHHSDYGHCKNLSLSLSFLCVTVKTLFILVGRGVEPVLTTEVFFIHSLLL
jgi:hypothetical protein